MHIRCVAASLCSTHKMPIATSPQVVTAPNWQLSPRAGVVGKGAPKLPLVENHWSRQWASLTITDITKRRNNYTPPASRCKNTGPPPDLPEGPQMNLIKLPDPAASLQEMQGTEEPAKLHWAHGGPGGRKVFWTNVPGSSTDKLWGKGRNAGTCTFRGLNLNKWARLLHWGMHTCLINL